MNKVEAAKLRLLTLAPYVKPSQNRKDINGLVNGGIQHISTTALNIRA